ncbi:MAG: FtsH protease activity modulator HflK [Candidatus Hydrogenedentes bacterium]|nr:FtsH protease activity modulator HflK [Candidatus Hydrogenedentota bacterium]
MPKPPPIRPEFVGGGGSADFKSVLRFVRAAAGAVVVLCLLLWIMRGGPTYTISAGEEGLVMTFGKYAKTSQPGFHFKLPWPIQTVEKVDIGEVKRIEVGFRSYEQEGTTAYRTFKDTPAMLSEAQMLTGDENVVDCSMAVQFRVKNSRDYLFNFERGQVERMLQAIAEAALRQAVGDHSINDVLTTGKQEIMNEIRDKMQELADTTGAGVSIQAVYLQDVQPPREVAAAFRDVASAREEREKLINEARAYQSGEIPRAEGEAAGIKLEAEAYKESKVAEARGTVQRFVAIAKQYEAAPELTRSRLYLEAMEELLPKVKLTVVDEATGVVNLKSLTGGAEPQVPEAIETSMEGNAQ